MRASVLECACPLALCRTFRSSEAIQSGSGQPHSKTWRQNVRFRRSPLFLADLPMGHEPAGECSVSTL